MKIRSSFGYTELISLKDILTRKNTVNKITSEKLFNLAQQPQNTCPLIDKAKSSISYEIDRAKSCLKDLDYWSGRYCSDDECCDNASNYEHNSRLINDYVSNLDGIISDLTEINEMLEYLRSDAESLREIGTKIKDGIWTVVRDRESIEDIKTELSTYLQKGINLDDEKFNYIHLRNNFKRMDNSNPRLSETFCRNKCDSYQKNTQLVEAFSNISSIDISEPDDIEKAIANKDKIYHWADELLDCLQSIINDEDYFAYNLDTEKENYIKELNESQIIKYNNFIKNLHLNRIKNLDKSKIPESYKTQEENLMVLKNVEKTIDNLNALINRYNSLDISCQELNNYDVEILFKKLYLDVESLAFDWDKNLYQMQESAKSIKIQIMNSLENNAPQIYAKE